MDQTELRQLLKTASDQLGTAQEVILELAQLNQSLEHAIASRDLAIKLASTGAIAMADITEKVAELEAKTEQDLVLEEKVASYHEDRGHRLHAQSGVTETTGLLSFLHH